MKRLMYSVPVCWYICWPLCLQYGVQMYLPAGAPVVDLTSRKLFTISDGTRAKFLGELAKPSPVFLLF